MSEAISIRDPLNAVVIQLDAHCDECEGKGRGKGLLSDHRCSQCDGTGYALTRDGFELMKFIRRHLHITINDV